jgi:hypothetical protein
METAVYAIHSINPEQKSIEVHQVCPERQQGVSMTSLVDDADLYGFARERIANPPASRRFG